MSVTPLHIARPGTPVAMRSGVQSRVYQQVRHGLMTGQFNPGQRLTIDTLSASLGTSHMPVREALRKLTGENVLVQCRNGSVMVPEIEARVLEDLCRSRLLLEGRAVELATVHVRGADIRHLRNLAQAHSQVSHGEGIYISLQRNQEFHFAVYRMAKSPILVELIEILWLRLGPYMRVLSQHLAPLVGTGNFRNGAHYHQDLINCLSERDGSGARFAIESDIRATYGMLCPLLPPGVS